MKLIISLLIITTLGTANAQKTQADSEIFPNRIYSEKIRTIQLYKDGWNLSYPLVKLNSNEKLVLHFDLLAEQAETFYYKFIHCDKDWKRSDIFTNDYLDGFPENPIENYETSFNTTVNYFHYNLSFPNDMVSFKLSGNYILFVYQAESPEEPVVTQRFIVSEDAVRIELTAHRPHMTKDNNTHQQIDFTVNYSGMSIIDPFRNVFASILQNGRWDNAKTNLKPDFYGNNELKYNSLSDNNIFQGGNEFRYFDIKSIRYQSEYVKKIEYNTPYYNVFLTPSESREFKPYFYWQDFNGKYYIAVQEGKKHDTDADYVYVYFTLLSKEQAPGGRVFVSGNLNNWELNSKNLMTYNRERGEYECTMLLKQGWYNYEYVFLPDGLSEGFSDLYEGNHYETENDYTVMLYYRNPRDRYDRVIGTLTANTLNRISN